MNFITCHMETMHRDPAAEDNMIFNNGSDAVFVRKHLQKFWCHATLPNSKVTVALGLFVFEHWMLAYTKRFRIVVGT